VTIVVDTNVLPFAGSLDSLEVSSLLALAKEHGHRVIMPWVVLEEASALQLNEVRSAFKVLRRAIGAARRFTPIEPLHLPNEVTVASRLRADLERRFEVQGLPSGAADEALRREAHHEPPALKKGGARDAAIWLTVKHLHLESNKPTHFVTNNHTDFCAPGGKNSLHPMLANELGSAVERFRFYPASSYLIAALANAADCHLDWDDIGRSSITQEAASQATDTLSIAGSSEYETRSLSFVEATETRCYQMENYLLAIANTEWAITGRVTTTSNTGVQLRQDFSGRIRMQLWVRLARSSQEPISAELHLMGNKELTQVIVGPRYITTYSIAAHGQSRIVGGAVISAGTAYNRAIIEPNTDTDASESPT
jgi:hypothetical protein